VSKRINLDAMTASGAGPAAQIMNAFKKAHQNIVFRSIDDLNAALNKFISTMNSSQTDDFLGLTPSKIHEILYGEYSFDNVLFTFKSQPNETYKNVAIVKEAQHYLKFLGSNAKIKLTATGSLPRAYVLSFYEDLKEGSEFLFKPNREADLFALCRMRIIVEALGWTNVQKGTLTLTKTGKDIIENVESSVEKLYLELLKSMATKYNWGYADRYDEFNIIQSGWLFGLYLLDAKAKDWVSCNSLSAIFERAFPMGNPYAAAEDEFLRGSFQRCFELRFLQRFCEPFGLVEFSEGARKFDRGNARVTDLFKRIFLWKAEK
jgi:hypothetical protein